MGSILPLSGIKIFLQTGGSVTISLSLLSGVRHVALAKLLGSTGLLLERLTKTSHILLRFAAMRFLAFHGGSSIWISFNEISHTRARALDRSFGDFLGIESKFVHFGDHFVNTKYEMDNG